VVKLISGFTDRKERVMGLLERREKEKDNRRMVILKSARKLFFAKGFKNVTVDEIAKFSELGKGSIYLYFSSKEEICAQILLHDIDIFHQQAFALFNKKKTATDSLFEFSFFYVDIFLNEPELFRILMTFMLHTDQMNLSEEQNKNIIVAMRKTIDVIGNIFQFGIDSQEFASTIDIKYNQFALWGMLNGIITLHIFSGSEDKRREKIHSTIKSTLQIYVKGLKQG
jgi:AcrR family transcriptional regulator